MIASLRKKFILITMGSLVLVLVVLMGIVNLANYMKMDKSSDDVLQILADNGGAFPMDDNMHGNEQKNPPGSGENAPDAPPDNKVAGDGNRRGMISAETPYETRYFSVTLDGNGQLKTVNTGKIAAVSTDEAVEMAQELSEKGKSTGYEGNYKYLAVDMDDGTLYIFLDCTRNLLSFKNFFYISLLVSLCGILAVFGLVLALSRRAIRPVAESYDKQKQFITNAGHEIKTPLTIIDSCTEVIEMEQGENKWTEGIRSQVRRLTELTQNLVSLARMDEDGVKLQMKDFSLSDAINEALEPFALLAETQGLRFSTDIQPGLNFYGNEKSIRQLFSILADNAVKYAASGSEIKFSMKKKGKKVTIVCENAAEGLKPGEQNVVFDRFYRGDASHSSEKSGYGIGLSLARSITAAHGGKISASSYDGNNFIITIQI